MTAKNVLLALLVVLSIFLPINAIDIMLSDGVEVVHSDTGEDDDHHYDTATSSSYNAVSISPPEAPSSHWKSSAAHPIHTTTYTLKESQEKVVQFLRRVLSTSSEQGHVIPMDAILPALSKRLGIAVSEDFLTNAVLNDSEFLSYFMKEHHTDLSEDCDGGSLQCWLKNIVVKIPDMKMEASGVKVSVLDMVCKGIDMGEITSVMNMTRPNITDIAGVSFGATNLGSNCKGRVKIEAGILKDTVTIAAKVSNGNLSGNLFMQAVEDIPHSMRMEYCTIKLSSSFTFSESPLSFLYNLVEPIVAAVFNEQIDTMVCGMITDMLAKDLTDAIHDVTGFIKPFLEEPEPLPPVDMSNSHLYVNTSEVGIISLLDMAINDIFLSDAAALNCFVNSLTKHTGDITLPLMGPDVNITFAIPSLANITLHVPLVNISGLNTFTDIQLIHLNDTLSPYEFFTHGALDRIDVKLPLNLTLATDRELLDADPYTTGFTIDMEIEDPHGAINFRPVFLKEKTRVTPINGLVHGKSSFSCLTAATHTNEMTTLDVFMAFEAEIHPADFITDSLEVQLIDFIAKTLTGLFLQPFKPYISHVIRGLSANLVRHAFNDIIEHQIRPTSEVDCRKHAPIPPAEPKYIDWQTSFLPKILEDIFNNALNGADDLNHLALCVFPNNGIGPAIIPPQTIPEVQMQALDSTTTTDRAFFVENEAVSSSGSSKAIDIDVRLPFHRFLDISAISSGSIDENVITGNVRLQRNVIRQHFSSAFVSSPPLSSQLDVEDSNFTALSQNNVHSADTKESAKINAVSLYGIGTLDDPFKLLQPSNASSIYNAVSIGSYNLKPENSPDWTDDPANPLSRAPLALFASLTVPVSVRSFDVNVTVYLRDVSAAGSFVADIDLNKLNSLSLHQFFSPCLACIMSDVRGHNVTMTVPGVEMYLTLLSHPELHLSSLEITGDEFAEKFKYITDLVASTAIAVVDNLVVVAKKDADYVCNDEPIPPPKKKPMNLSNLYYLAVGLFTILITGAISLYVAGEDGTDNSSFFYRLVCCSWHRRFQLVTPRLKSSIKSDAAEIDTHSTKYDSNPYSTHGTGTFPSYDPDDRRSGISSQATRDKPHKRNDNNPSLICSPLINIILGVLVFIILVGIIVAFFFSNTQNGAQVIVQLKSAAQIASLGPIFNFTVISTVRDMLLAKVYGLFLLVAGMSGAWPYIKIFMMLACWVLPQKRMSHATRETMLIWLDRLGKWSMIDSFVLVMMIVAFRFDVSVIPEFFAIQVLVHSDIAFYVFLFATMASLTMSHIILAFHRATSNPMDYTHAVGPKHTEAIMNHVHHVCLIPGSHYIAKDLVTEGVKIHSTNTDHLHTSLNGNLFANGSEINRAGVYRVRMKCTAFGKIVTPLVLLLMIFATILGAYLDTFVFTFRGLVAWLMEDSDRHVSYSLISLANVVVASSDEPGSIGVRLIQISFRLFALIFPILYCLTMLLSWFIPMSTKTHRKIHVLSEVFLAWAGLDVFLVSILGAVTQISLFSQFIIGSICEPMNPYLEQFMDSVLEGYPRCFDMNASFLSGVWVLIFAVVLYLTVGQALGSISHSALADRSLSFRVTGASQTDIANKLLGKSHYDAVEADHNSLLSVNGGSERGNSAYLTVHQPDFISFSEDKSPDVSKGREDDGLELHPEIKAWYDRMFIQQLGQQYERKDDAIDAAAQLGVFSNPNVAPASFFTRLGSTQAWLGFMYSFSKLGLFTLYGEPVAADVVTDNSF